MVFSSDFSEHGRLRSDFSDVLSEQSGSRSDLSRELSEHGGLRSDLIDRLRFCKSDRLNGHGLRGRCGLSHSELRVCKSCELREHYGVRSYLSVECGEHGGFRLDLSGRLSEHGLQGCCGLSHSGLSAGMSCELKKHSRRVRCELCRSERM